MEIVKQFRKAEATQSEFYVWLAQVKKLMTNAGFTEYKNDFGLYMKKWFPKNFELYTEVAFEDCSWYQHFLTLKD